MMFSHFHLSLLWDCFLAARGRLCFAFAMTMALTSCAALEPSAATVQPALETPPPSPTFDWFPASATPTLEVLATHTATPERRPGLGRIILSDDFSDPDLWTVAVSDQASAAIQDKRLTIAVQPGVYMISQRRDLVFSDFYAEITARPILCRGADDYGLLVRGSSIAYYRFTLSCNGTARVKR